MTKLLDIVLLAVFMTPYTGAVQYVFHYPTYTTVEVPGSDTPYATVMISRTDESPQEQAVNRSIAISTNCPNGIFATAASTDYSIPSFSVVFPAGKLEMEVPVLIEDDDVEEVDEFFCLTIEQDQGSEYYTKIMIPENDFCYDLSVCYSLGDYLFEDGITQYVSPWITSLSNVVEFEITTPVLGQDISIFLSTHANKDNADLEWYQIILDDSDGHDANPGDTVLYKNGLTTGEYLSTLVTGDDLLADGGTLRFWLKYDESTGTISLGDPSDRNQPWASYSDGSGNALKVKHIYVKSSKEVATFKVCLPATPKMLDVVGANAVGYQVGRGLDNAFDGNTNVVFEVDSCFLTSTVDDPWLQVDLGEDFHVRTVLIWKVITDAILDAGDLDGAQVFVGSCPSDNIVGNTLCYTADTGPADNANPIEGECPELTNGRYVYIYKPTTNTDTTQFSLCEVEVFGTAVPYGSQTTVQFTQEEYVVHENNGIVQLDTYRSVGTGGSTSCTLAEYYTDSAVSPTTADSNDFDPIFNDPLTASMRQVSWDGNDASGESVLQTVTITINNDNPGVCEAYETFNVYLANVVGGILGEQSWARVKIIDDDSVWFSLTQDMYTVSEGDEFLNIDVTRSGVGTMQPGSAELTFTDNTATSVDYDNVPFSINFDASTNAETQSGDVEINDDPIFEENESFTVNLGSLTPSDKCSVYGDYPTVIVTITDNDSRFRFNVENGVIIFIPEGESRDIVIGREGTVQDKTLDIVVKEGTADLGDDFTISPSPSSSISSVIFVKNDDEATITINTETDSEMEGRESFTLTLRDPLYPDGNRADPYSLTIIIVENDAGYFWKQTSYAVQERSGSISVCLVRTGDTEARTVYITSASVSAIPGVDYTPLTEIEFIEGVREACVKVRIIDNTALESNKDFLLTINSDQNIIVNTDNTARVTIIDDDSSVGWSLAAYSFTEGSTENNVIITKSARPSVTVTISIKPGTAMLYNDYDLNIGSSKIITIPPGKQRYYIPVTIINDKEDEVNEIFTLMLSNVSLGIISQSQTTITIIDDDLTTELSDAGGLGIGSIVGIAAGALVGVVLIIFVGVAFCWTTTRSAAAATAPGVPLTTYPPAAYVSNVSVSGYVVGGLANAGNNPNIYGPYR